MYLDTVFHFTNQLVTRFKQGAQLVPVVYRKPHVVRHWLVNARAAQIALLVLALGVPLVLNPLLDMLLELIFSPVTEKTLFGLISTTKDNPYLDTVQTITHWLVWIGAVLSFVYLLLRKLPDTVAYAKQMVLQNIAQAEQLKPVKPSESIVLYTRAAAWNLDADTASVLSNQLHAVGDSVFDQLDKTVMMTQQVSASQPLNAVIADRYAIKILLGSGAMGNVYLAEDTRLKREVALKQLAPRLSADEHLIARFRQEAVALARLSHPHIVQVYDFLEAEGFFWIAMELVKGGELEDKLNSGDTLDLDTTIRLIKQMAEALGYAHEQGVVHRDFKPANVLLTEKGDIKISDFGIAKLAQSSIHTQLNTVLGTPSYMSPEQANGEVADFRTDIYSLGVVFYQMLSGSLPFNGDSRSVIAQHISKAPPSLCEKHQQIPAAIDQVVQKMLAKQPADRYDAMAEIVEMLDAAGKKPRTRPVARRQKKN